MVDLLGSFVSAFMQVLLDRLTHLELINFFRGNHLDEALLEKLKMLLLSVTTVLSDAEEKQFIDPLVKEWVDRLKNAAYDADDLLDEIATKAFQDNMESSLHKTLDQVRDYASSLNPFAQRIKSKVDRIIERLQSVIEHKDLLGLKKGGVGKSLQFASSTTSLVDEHQVYGRNGDKEKIVDYLLSGNSDGEGVPVVAIVGMGGVGKTTLAQILYNDLKLRNHFQLRSWTSVSESSDVYEITKKVLESFTLWYTNITDLNVLQIKLKDRLTRQKFLLVLDGYWNENFLDWDILQRPFQSGNNGSRIIVTTRSQSVAVSIRADLTHSLSFLSHEDTWRLFSSHAFKSGNPDKHPVLKHIGQKIVQKCNGLPLAAKTLASLLHSIEDAEEWESIANSRIWELPSDKSSILPALKLSYDHLPSHLKRCFAYCSIFPKGYEIKKWNLILLWMAEGILPQPKAQKRVEDIGDECFQELLSRSLFHQSTHHISCFMMHDLISDLAQCVAGEFCYKLDSNTPSKITMRVRHLSYLQGIYDDPEKFEALSEFQQLRTFLPFRFSDYYGKSPSVTSMVSILLPKLKRLRVLSLSHYPITKLPDSVGNLMHLRYLDLSYTGIERLPDSASTLYNLETLLLVGCCHLTKLPTNMCNLVNLRHLDISGSSVMEMPPKFGRLKSLQVLSSFVVSSEGGSKVAELGNLSELHGALLIVNLQNAVDATEVSKARLRSKKYLHELELKWTTTTHNVQSETNVLDTLEPHQNMKRLKIHNFGGDKLPNWLGSSFSSMVFLHLVDCQNCLSLPSLGQLPSLRELYVAKMTGLQKLGPEFYGDVTEPFRSLAIMKFEDMPNWEEWSTSIVDQYGGFPSLQELHIQRCPKLTTKLPDLLPSLDKLVITACQALKDSSPWAPRLRVLELTGCDALVSLSEQMMHGNHCLQIMAIRNCSSLFTIPKDGLPSTLRSLEIYECRNLQLFPPHFLMQESHYYPALEHLHLKSCCNSLISLSLSLFTNLEDLHVQDCSNLQLISSATNSLPYLQKLKLKDCSNLVWFPEGGFLAPKLETLCISKCADLSHETAWGLQAMTSLTSLHISGLPSHTSLEHTGIQHLESLKVLKIKACDNLASLPLDRLVTTLSHLTIRACPLLKVLCERDKGEYWGLVSRIPSIIIED